MEYNFSSTQKHVLSNPVPLVMQVDCSKTVQVNFIVVLDRGKCAKLGIYVLNPARFAPGRRARSEVL
jgi:hypothetical protein